MMNNIQINGQKRWGPPEDWTGPPPPHGTEVFIKNLPEEVFEFELYALFSMVSTVYEVRLPVNWSGFNKGYAFVRYTTVRGADQAIERLDGYQIRTNRKIKVSRSVDNTRLFLSSVPTDKTAEELKTELLNYVDNVSKVYVYPTLENRSVFRGYAFVEFETHRDAAIAKRILTPDVCCGIFQKKCVAAWANPLPFLDQSVLNSLNVLFMRNIPKDIKGFHLKKIVETLIGGEIKSVKKINDFAFLTFKDHNTARRALNCLKNIPFLIPDREMQVEWAIPREVVTNSTIEREYEPLNSSKKRSEKTELSFDDNFQTDNISPSFTDYQGYFSEFSDGTDTFVNSNTFEKPYLMADEISALEMTKPHGENTAIPRWTSKQMGRQGVQTGNNSYILNDNSPEYISRSTNNMLIPTVNRMSVKKPEQEYLGRYSDIRNPLSSIPRSVESVEGCPFSRNFSPDSDHDSRDSEDGVLYTNRLGTSPYSPVSSPGPTNRSSVSSILSCDESQETFLPHLLHDFHINQASLDVFNIADCESQTERSKTYKKLTTWNAKNSFGTRSALNGNLEENFHEK